MRRHRTSVPLPRWAPPTTKEGSNLQPEDQKNDWCPCAAVHRVAFPGFLQSQCAGLSALFSRLLTANVSGLQATHTQTARLARRMVDATTGHQSVVVLRRYIRAAGLP